MTKNINYAFVWKEEQEKLREFARQVPDSGIIIEIGTARGGTARIFYDETRMRGVRIYSIDTLPDIRAKANLKDTNVCLVNKSSVEYASVWKKEGARQIDMLFVDGDHNLYSIYEDFNNWALFLKSGGVVIFHDYDPIERGGLAHFAVRICIDTLCRIEALKNIKQEYKLLSGKVDKTIAAKIKISDYLDTFIDIGKNIEILRKKVFISSVRSGMRVINERTIPFDSVQACYCIEYALQNDFNYLDSITRSFSDFRKWTELFLIFQHSCGASLFPGRAEEINQPVTILELSKLVAKEQVKISILSLILKTFVDWNP